MPSSWPEQVLAVGAADASSVLSPLSKAKTEGSLATGVSQGGRRDGKARPTQGHSVHCLLPGCPVGDGLLGKELGPCVAVCTLVGRTSVTEARTECGRGDAPRDSRLSSVFWTSGAVTQSLW